MNPDYLVHEVWYQTNEGNGAFGAGKEKLELEHPMELGPLINFAVADFNNDGLSDVLVQYLGYGFLLWLNEGEAQFGFVELDLPEGFINDVADIDGDGFVDVLYNDSSQDSLIGWNVNGVTLVPGPVIRMLRLPMSGPPQLVDFDGDGDSDLVKVSRNRLDLYRNISDISLQNVQLVDGSRLAVRVHSESIIAANTPVQILRSEDLLNWEMVANAEVGEKSTIILEEEMDTASGNYFYRVRLNAR